MDQSEARQAQQQQQQPMMAYGPHSYQTMAMVAPSTHPTALTSPTQLSSMTSNSSPLAFQHQHQHQQQLQMFWANQMQEIEQTTNFKDHSLPLARIKKIMKADEDVRMISAEAPVIFAKACEMFILELSLRAWIHTEENKRRTLQKNDIVAAISRTDVFDFLVDIIPRDELKEEGLGVTKASIPMVGSSADMSCYYGPPLQHSGMIIGKPVDQTSVFAGATAAQQPGPPMAFMPWLQGRQQQEHDES